MHLKPEQLADHLKQELKPVYLIGGDEELLVLEAADQVRAAARAAGCEDRRVFHIEAQFDWNELASQADSLSLFSTRRLLDLRMPTGKPGREGGAWFRAQAERSSDDILLISTGALGKDKMNSAWVKALDRAGVVVRCWPIELHDLPGWLHDRMLSRGLTPEGVACRLLAERVEGNLLAAAQEVDKLKVLKGEGKVSAEDIQELVADSSRFDVFRLVDAALSGESGRALRMVASLRSEGVPLPIVNWAFSRELRLVCQMRRALNNGGNIPALLRKSGVWEKRARVLQQAMRRCGLDFWCGALAACARIDRMIKGREDGDPWLAIERLSVKVAMSGRRS
jgi:DNA polymerase-3 subunit delta